jgi:TatD DNase family protein
LSAVWPPLDMHAHVNVELDATDLLGLRAVIFAATRTLDEAHLGLARQYRDMLTVWGVGVHPASPMALDAFDVNVFASLIMDSAYVSEVGLDGKVRSGLRLQRSVLADILSVLQENPRITSLHSYAATDDLIAELHRAPIKGAILHWWRGGRDATEKALEQGAYFSFNAASLHDTDLLSQIPLDRILIETDHPHGDRRSVTPRQPGRVEFVENALANIHGIPQDELRLAMWQNLRKLVNDTGSERRLPERVAAILAATRPPIH